MRELKFRAWDAKGKTMFYPHEIFESKSGQRIGIVANNPDSILMQFTGLKDKNGKEIYEGDVLKLAEGDDGSVYACVICWNEKTCAFAGRRLDESEPYCNFLFGVEIAEIIGNIYENPELLKV